MKTIAPSLLVFSICLSFTYAEDPVHFEDPLLKERVEDTLQRYEPRPSDMLDLIELKCIYIDLSDLTGLEYAVNLQTLWVRHTDVWDVTPLENLTSLVTLIINNNRIRDVSVLSNLINLEHLDMHDNKITDISVVAGFTGLTTLIFRGNPVRNISPLTHLNSLQDLDLRWASVSNILPLTELSSLKNVVLVGNPISRTACELYIPEIYANNPGVSIEYNCMPLRLTIASGPGGSVVAPGEGAFEYETRGYAPLIAEADFGFAFSHWSGDFSGKDASIELFM